MKKKQMITVTVLNGNEGDSLYINDYRVMGPKPWGGGRTIFESSIPEEKFMDEFIMAIGDKNMEHLINKYKCKKSGHTFVNTGETYVNVKGNIMEIYECSCCGKKHGYAIGKKPDENNQHL